MAKTESVTALIEQSIKVNKAILKELREQNRHLRVLESKISALHQPKDIKVDCASFTPYIDYSSSGNFMGTDNY